MKLLIVDDSSMLREMLSDTLHSGGYYDITESIDGIDGLNQAKNNIFDLIIADINMPNMDGINMISEIRKLPNYSKIPILVLTTERDNITKLKGKEAGATGWIIKPFIAEQLLKAINIVLNKN